MREWMTIDDLCEYLQVPKTKIRHFIKQRQIPYHDKFGSPRFFKSEIDDWMRSEIVEKQEFFYGEDPFIYRGKSIKAYMLSASKVLIGPKAWSRLPDFLKKSVGVYNEMDRAYLFRKDFEPIMNNFNDYLRVCCQLGFIDNERVGRVAHYIPTEYSQRIYEESEVDPRKQIFLDGIIEIVKQGKEIIPQERHAIFLLWYLLKIREQNLEPKESHFNKGGETTYFPLIRLNFSVSFCDFLFGKDREKEQEFLKDWDQHI